MTLFTLALALLLLGLNAFFVLAEFAMVKLRPTRVEELEEQGDPRAAAVRRIQRQLDDYLSVCQVGITLASIGLGFVGELAISKLVAGLIGAEAGAAGTALAHTIAISVAYLIVSFLHILLGELVPKSLAIREPERWALLTQAPLRFFRVLFYVPILVLPPAAAVVLRALGVPRRPVDPHHTEDELRIILARSQTSGLMSFRRLLFLENIFDLGELRVREAMKVRSGVKALRAESTPEEVLKTIREARFSRYPLTVEGQDRPLGIIHVKDLVLAGGAPQDLKKLARPYHTTTEETMVEALLTDLQRKRGHMTIVVDGAGKWTGLITMEDIIEEIIGTVEDEFEVSSTITLSDALSADRTLVGLEAESLEQAIGRALALVRPADLPKPAARLEELLLERERQMSTYLGNGIALPHARLETVEKPFVVLARSEQGIPIRGTNERAHILFILFTPAGSPHTQVRLLARIAGIMESEYVGTRIREAQTVPGILEAIRAGETASLG